MYSGIAAHKEGKEINICLVKCWLWVPRGGVSYTYNEIILAAGVGQSVSFKIQNGSITIVPHSYESSNFQNYYAFENGQIVANYQNPNGRFKALYDGEKITITNQTSGYVGRIFVYGDWLYLT